jgi:hypothetical protein
MNINEIQTYIVNNAKNRNIMKMFNTYRIKVNSDINGILYLDTYRKLLTNKQVITLRKELKILFPNHFISI